MADRTGLAGASLESHCFGLRQGGSFIHTCGHSFSGNRNDLEASDGCSCVYSLHREYCSVSTVVFYGVDPPLVCLELFPTFAVFQRAERSQRDVK